MTTLVEYLGTTYDPDREYIDGILRNRNVGEISHSDAQGRTYFFVQSKYRGFWAGVEVRVQVQRERFRVPDVTIVRGGKPMGRIITTPPEIVVEVLSPDDRATDMQDKVDGYLAFGIPCVWVLRPETQRAWIHTVDAAREVRDGMLRNPAGDVVVPLSAIFTD